MPTLTTVTPSTEAALDVGLSSLSLESNVGINEVDGLLLLPASVVLQHEVNISDRFVRATDDDVVSGSQESNTKRNLKSSLLSSLLQSLTGLYELVVEMTGSTGGAREMSSDLACSTVIFSR